MAKTRVIFAILIASFLIFDFLAYQPQAKSLLQAHAPKALFDGPHCFLTLNEIVGKDGSTGELLGREMEINWRNVDDQAKDDWIGLFDYDPSLQDGSNKDHYNLALDRFTVDSGSGREKTGVRIQAMNYTLQETRAGNCLPYYVGYFESKESKVSLLSNCFRLYPTWLNDLKATIGDTPLNSLMIPGTHDAGAWQVYDGKNDNLISRYTMTQEENILNQCIAGIRYFDIRAAHYPNDAEDIFWLNHDVVKIRPMRTVLADIAQFVKQTNEIILLDFHRFPVGFDGNADTHSKFHQFVEGFLADVMAPKSLGSNVTPNQLWRAGKNVVVSYADDYQRQHENLWPYLNQAWGDVNKLTALEEYIPRAIAENGCKGQFWSTMAELTPKPEDIIINPNKGLRGMAYDVNKPLTNWYMNRAFYSKTNIVATDFFLGNNVIETCVTVNTNRGIEC